MKTKKLVYIAIFIAIGFIFSRFLTFQTSIIKVGFGFIPAILSSIVFGPFMGGIINALVDIFGAILIPKGGAFFPGFTLSTFISGAIYGLFLYRRKVNFINLSLAIITNMVLISFLLNTYWISLLQGKGFLAFLSTRITTNLIKLPVEIITFLLLYKYLEKSGTIEKLKNI